MKIFYSKNNKVEDNEPDENICIDEIMVPFHEQYICDKRHIESNKTCYDTIEICVAYKSFYTSITLVENLLKKKYLTEECYEKIEKVF